MLNCIPHHPWFLTGVHNSWQEDACSLNELVLSYWLFLLLALTQTRNEKFWSLRCSHSYATKAVLGAVILDTKQCISPAQRNKPGKLTFGCLPGEWPLAPDTNSWAERTKLESVSSFHYSSGLFSVFLAPEKKQKDEKARPRKLTSLTSAYWPPVLSQWSLFPY